jgi:hypothetical protein
MLRRAVVFPAGRPLVLRNARLAARALISSRRWAWVGTGFFDFFVRFVRAWALANASDFVMAMRSACVGPRAPRGRNPPPGRFSPRYGRVDALARFVDGQRTGEHGVEPLGFEPPPIDARRGQRHAHHRCRLSHAAEQGESAAIGQCHVGDEQIGALTNGELQRAPRRLRHPDRVPASPKAIRQKRRTFARFLGHDNPRTPCTLAHETCNAQACHVRSPPSESTPSNNALEYRRSPKFCRWGGCGLSFFQKSFRASVGHRHET